MTSCHKSTTLEKKVVHGLSLITIRTTLCEVKTCTVQVQVEVQYSASEASQSDLVLRAPRKFHVAEIRLGDVLVSK